MALGELEVDTKALQNFRMALRKSMRDVQDLRVPLSLIGKRFFASREFIFKAKNRGQYRDLTPRYKDTKLRDKGFIYPILRRDGHLEKSITDYNDPRAIAVAKKTNLIVGTSVPYAHYHQDKAPRRKLPRRPFLFWGPESPRFASQTWVVKFNKNIRYILEHYVRNELMDRADQASKKSKDRPSFKTKPSRKKKR